MSERVVFEVDCSIGVFPFRRFEDRIVCSAGSGIPSGRRQTVDNKVHLPEILSDHTDGLLLNFSRKGIAVN